MTSFANDYNNIEASCIGYVLTFTIAFMIRGCFRASQATHPPTQWEPATPYRPCAPALLLGSDNVRNCAADRRAAAANLALDIPQLPNPFQHRRESERQSDQEWVRCLI